MNKNIVIFLLVVFTIGLLFSFGARPYRWYWSVYWLGAALLNVGILGGMK